MKKNNTCGIHVPRFVYEYANYKLREIEQYIDNDESAREQWRVISNAVRVCERGYITIDECMKFINRP